MRTFSPKWPLICRLKIAPYQRLEHFQQKWAPVLRRKMRKNKELEHSTEPSEVKNAFKRAGNRQKKCG